MSHNFKSGDQVIIIGANTLTQNIGKQCELRELVVEGQCYVAPNGEVYEHKGSPCWTLVGEGLLAIVEGELVEFGFGCHEPRHLMPLKGEFEPEQQKSLEVME